MKLSCYGLLACRLNVLKDIGIIAQQTQSLGKAGFIGLFWKYDK